MIQLMMAACIMIFPSLVAAYQMSGRVLRVDNGNTMTIVDSNNVQHTVRLQDVQAPGLNKPKGVQSRRNLQEMVGGRLVIGATHHSGNCLKASIKNNRNFWKSLCF